MFVDSGGTHGWHPQSFNVTNIIFLLSVATLVINRPAPRVKGHLLSREPILERESQSLDTETHDSSNSALCKFLFYRPSCNNLTLEHSILHLARCDSNLRIVQRI